MSQHIEQDSFRWVQVKDIHIVGNKKTKESIITRELSVERGESYSLRSLVDMLAFDRDRIYNTNLFSEVDIKVQELGAGAVTLLIVVKERWYFYPVPIFKLADRNFNDWWVTQNHDLDRITYGIRLTQYNVRGRNELLRLTFQSGFDRRFLFHYRIPYIDKKQRHGLTSRFILEANNNVSYQTADHLRKFLEGNVRLKKTTGGDILHTYRKNFYVFHFMNLGIISTQIADTLALLNPNYLGDGRTHQKFVRIGYGYKSDHRDNVNYPTSGSHFFVNLTKTGLGIFDDVDYWTIQGLFSKYKDLGRGYSFGNAISGYVSIGNQPFFNFYGLGFDKHVQVRGYELDLVEGQAFLLSKNSFRKFLWKHKSDISRIMPLEQFNTFPIALYGKLFFDGGYVKSFKGYENNDRLTDKVLYGLGVGLDVVTLYDLVIKFEYSTNRDHENQLFLNFQVAF